MFIRFLKQIRVAGSSNISFELNVYIAFIIAYLTLEYVSGRSSICVFQNKLEKFTHNATEKLGAEQITNLKCIILEELAKIAIVCKAFGLRTLAWLLYNMNSLGIWTRKCIRTVKKLSLKLSQDLYVSSIALQKNFTFLLHSSKVRKFCLPCL